MLRYFIISIGSVCPGRLYLQLVLQRCAHLIHIIILSDTDYKSTKNRFYFKYTVNSAVILGRKSIIWSNIFKVKGCKIQFFAIISLAMAPMDLTSRIKIEEHKICNKSYYIKFFIFLTLLEIAGREPATLYKVKYQFNNYCLD